MSLRSTVNVLSRELAVATERAEALRQELATLRQEHAQLASMVDVFGAPDVVRVDLRGTEPGGERDRPGLRQPQPGPGLHRRRPAGASGRDGSISSGSSRRVRRPSQRRPVPVDSSGGRGSTVDLPQGVTSVGDCGRDRTSRDRRARPGPRPRPLLAGTVGG